MRGWGAGSCDSTLTFRSCQLCQRRSSLRLTILYNGMTTTVPFINSLSSGVNSSTARASHSHGPGEHGHTHEHLDHPGGLFHSSVVRKLIPVSYRQILRTGHARILVTKFRRARLHCRHWGVSRSRPNLSGSFPLSDAPGPSALEKLHWLSPSVGTSEPSTTLVWVYGRS